MKKPMKINKIILRIFHFFGKRMEESHIDDIAFYLPTVYPEKDFDRWGPTYMRSKDSDWVIEDIKSQVYRKLEEDKKFKENCTKVEQVYINTIDGSCIRLLYKEGVLYYPCKSDMESLRREENLNKILQ